MRVEEKHGQNKVKIRYRVCPEAAAAASAAAAATAAAAAAAAAAVAAAGGGDVLPLVMVALVLNGISTL
ncbi:hypothetical protein VYU27_009622 [Nannochloropsis oceanica]